MAGKSNNQLMWEAVQLARHSKIPIMFLSNPGAGKTSLMNAMNAKVGIGMKAIAPSHYSADDFQGFQFKNELDNGEVMMSRLLPAWFVDLRKLADTHEEVSLFLDEITTANAELQAAYLTVIFDRRVGEYKIPDNVNIYAAGNFSSNLNHEFDISAPLWTRFMLLNLIPKPEEDLREFLFADTVSGQEWIEPTEFTIVGYSVNETRTKINEVLFQWCREKITQGDLSLNQAVSNFGATDLVDDEDIEYVENIPTNRTIFYLSKLIYSSYCLGLMESEVMPHLVAGLIGNGTESCKKKGESSLLGVNLMKRFISDSILSPSKASGSSGEVVDPLTGKLVGEITSSKAANMTKIELKNSLDVIAGFYTKKVVNGNEQNFYSKEDYKKIYVVLEAWREKSENIRSEETRYHSFLQLNSELIKQIKDSL